MNVLPVSHRRNCLFTIVRAKEREKNHVHRQLGMSDIDDPRRQSLPLA